MTARSGTLATERPQQRHGSNLYPVRFNQKFGDLELTLDVPEGVWNPTPHGIHLGEMLLRIDFTGKQVLELGTGCGIHAILLALRGAARLTLTEIDAAVCDNARHNLAANAVTTPTEYIVADWTAVPGASHAGDAPWDSVVTNPPFAKSGKRYRRYFIDMLILDAHKLVRPGGRLVFVQSSMGDIPRSLRLMAEHGMSPDEYEALAKDVRLQVRDAGKWADASPVPDASELYRDVYADEWGPYLGTTPPPMLGEGPGPGPTEPPQPA